VPAHVAVAAAFGEGHYGTATSAGALWRSKAVDLSRSRCFEQWHSPVTVSMAVDLTAAWWSGLL
jgi:hypothetical protein